MMSTVTYHATNLLRRTSADSALSFCFFTFVVVLVALTAILYAFQDSVWLQLDWCAIDRYAPANKALVRSAKQGWKAYADIIKALIWCGLGGVKMIGPQPARRRAADRYVPIVLNKVAVVQTALTYLTSVGGHLIVSSLKILSGDTTCSAHSNGVSGHYNFWVFSLVSLACLHITQVYATVSASSRRPVSLLQLFDQLFVCPGVPYSATFMLVYLLYLLIGLVSMYDTFRLGFHSPRQLLYGVLFALYLHTALFYFVHRRLNCFLPLTNSAWADSLEVLPVLYLDILSVTVGVYTQSTIASLPREATRSVLDAPSLSFMFLLWLALCLFLYRTAHTTPAQSDLQRPKTH